ncbi:MAG: hypothetical protein WCO02_07490 [Bacteroidota bacterium]
MNIFRRLIFLAGIFTLNSSVSFAQLEKYFIPNSEYFLKEFQYETKTWTNANGSFQKKNTIQYFLDNTGNYKKYISSESYRYNVLQSPILHVHQFYNISSNSVTLIYDYVEGLGDFGKKELNIIVLKKAGSSWQDKHDKDVTDYYSCSVGKLKTEYANYDNCLIVTKTSKTNSPDLKWAEALSEKFYYAYNLGLVKTEEFMYGKLTDESFGYGGTLVDNFSEYSFVQKSLKEQQRIYAENKKREEEERLRNFLDLRKTTVFAYAEIEAVKFNQLKSDIDNQVLKLAENDSRDITFKTDINYQVDTNKVVTRILNPIVSENKGFEDSLRFAIEKIQFQPAYKDGYTVNAKCNINIDYSKYKRVFSLKYSKGNLVLKEGDNDSFEKTKSFISSEMMIKGYPDGSYKVEYSMVSFDQKLQESLKVIEYKGFGGAGFALLSVLIPGLGDHFVNGGHGTFLGKKVSPWVTTVGTLAIVGTGVYLKYSSNKNYGKYHDATQQSDMDHYYNLANNQNKAAWLIIGAGGIIWLTDIIWVAAKGAKNTKETKSFKNKINLSVYPSVDLNQNIAINFKFKF